MRTPAIAARSTAGWAALPLLVLFLAAGSPAASAQDTLSLVSTAWPPFTNAQGQPRFALDLVETALQRAGIATRTTIVTPRDFDTALVDGPYDGSAAAWKSEARERVLVFSEPYLENRLVLIGTHGADVSATTLAALAGKRIAIVAGYAYGDEVEGSGPVFVRASSEEDCLKRLLAGEADYTLMDDLVVQYIVTQYPTESSNKLEIGTTPLVRRPLYLAVRRSRPNADAIIAHFNEQIRGMIADHTYHRLLHLDWIRADANGDGIPEYVPASDHPARQPPPRTYSLFAEGETKPTTKTGFFLGGNIYESWASVPESYKQVNPHPPDARRSTATIFSFAW